MYIVYICIWYTLLNCKSRNVYVLIPLILQFSYHLLAIKKSNLLITGWVESNETCRPRQEYRKRFGSNVPIPAYIDFQCRQSGSRHIRSATDEGTLIVTFTFSEEIPFNCDFECLDRISWTLRFQFYEIQWRVATGLTLSVVNLETSEQVNVTLMGELQAESELQISCALGQILSQDQGFCSKSLRGIQYVKFNIRYMYIYIIM